jgi:biopolymer transport protein ExbD
MFIHGDKDVNPRRIAESFGVARSAGVDHVGIITPGIVAEGIVANR